MNTARTTFPHRNSSYVFKQICNKTYGYRLKSMLQCSRQTSWFWARHESELVMWSFFFSSTLTQYLPPKGVNYTGETVVNKTQVTLVITGSFGQVTHAHCVPASPRTQRTKSPPRPSRGFTAWDIKHMRGWGHMNALDKEKNRLIISYYTVSSISPTIFNRNYGRNQERLVFPGSSSLITRCISKKPAVWQWERKASDSRDLPPDGPTRSKHRLSSQHTQIYPDCAASMHTLRWDALW